METMALPGTVRFCSVCGEEEGNQWFKVGRCDTKGGGPDEPE